LIHVWLLLDTGIFQSNLDLDGETAAQRMLNDMKNNPDRSVENNGQIESKEQMMDKSRNA